MQRAESFSPERNDAKMVSMKEMKKLRAELGALDQKKRDLHAEMDYADRAVKALQFIRDIDASTLERPATTFSHHLRDALRRNDFIDIQSDNRRKIDGREYETYIFGGAKYFLIQHNWATAFRGATDYAEGEFRLPFEVCVFEFKIAGCRIAVPAVETDGVIKCTPIIETPFGWTVIGYVFDLNDQTKPKGSEFNLLSVLIDQLRAVCIALDAEVADIDLQATPPKLNKAREKAKKPPISDHHVIYLSHRRHGHGTGDGVGVKRRLHFRRGHWRHYEDRRTWIRWTLVGNPDLGFVDKEYRL